MKATSRRLLLQQGLALAGAGALAGWPARLLAAPRFASNPFTSGVASGYPTPESVVLWTRLAPEPLAPDRGMPPADVPVSWELAADERFTRIVRSGVAYAESEWGHSVHVEPPGLEPGRQWWYRFTAGGVRSPVGRTWTAPPASAMPERLRAAVVSCQQYEHGYYVGYRQIVADAPDLVVHVGDYIYEMSWGEDRVRSHGAGECYTLADYRARHALYRSDADLQAAHANCPWLMVWDDHEVDNDYAGDSSEQADDPSAFRQRRAAAYRAWYEFMPLPRRMVPYGADMRIHAAPVYGDLLALQLLDERQYRSSQACPSPGRGGSRRVRPEECADFFSDARTMLGARQEAWLGAQFAASRARWNLVTQGVVTAYIDEEKPPARRYWTDGWNGYPAARTRLLRQIESTRLRNPVILGGDIHAFVISDLHSDAADPATPLVASELVTTSITSQGAAADMIERLRANNPATQLADGDARGYLRLDIGRKELRADLVKMDTVKERTSGARVLAAFVLEEGRRGLQRA
jgi:alkaline phosphatase D